VSNLERVVEKTLSKVWLELQNIRVRISTHFSFVAGVISLEDDSNESKRAFYLLSFMLLISLVFLSPDKVPQAFSPMQADNGIFEKAQEITKIIRKPISNVV
jgi:hypothetical protein